MMIFYKVLFVLVTVLGVWLANDLQHKQMEADFRAIHPEPPAVAPGIQPARPHRDGRARPMGTSLQYYRPR